MKQINRLILLSSLVLISAESLSVHLFAYGAFQNVQEIDINTNNIGYHKTFNFYYGIPDSGIGDKLLSFKNINVRIYTNVLNPPQILPMEKLNGSWKAPYTVNDTTVKMILFSFEGFDSVRTEENIIIDDNYGQYWDYLICRPDNEPVEGAHQARSVSYTGLGNKRTEDIGRALVEIQNELDYYPNNYSARILFFTLLLKQNNYDKRTRQEIKKQIDNELPLHSQNEKYLNFASTVYRLIGNMEDAQQIDQKLIQINPKGERASMKSFRDILNIEDAETRFNKLDTFLQEYPNSRITEYALVNMASVAIELNDSTKLISVADRLLARASTMNAANGLAGVAGALSEKSIELDRAEAYAQTALSLVNSIGIHARPPQMTEGEWNLQIESMKARYQDILGWIHFQKGKYQTSLKLLRESVRTTSLASGYYHLAQIYEKSDSVEQAILNYAKAAAFGDEMQKLASASLKKLWIASERDTSQIEPFIGNQEESIQQKYRKKIISQASTRPAPDFELIDKTGSWVRLSDQKDNIVLLCFWATWSESSIMMLEALQLLTEEYGQDILFLSIATDPDQNSVKDFIENKDIFIPVLFNNNTDRDYNLYGVPTLFVIDEEGIIHFEHKGYRPDLLQILEVELDYLRESSK